MKRIEECRVGEEGYVGREVRKHAFPCEGRLYMHNGITGETTSRPMLLIDPYDQVMKARPPDIVSEWRRVQAAQKAEGPASETVREGYRHGVDTAMTTDVGEAARLITAGAPLQAIRERPGKPPEFVFLLEDYESHTGRPEAVKAMAGVVAAWRPGLR
jgi:hypothetical protein